MTDSTTGTTDRYPDDPLTLRDLLSVVRSFRTDRLFSWKKDGDWRRLSSDRFADLVDALARHLHDPEGSYRIEKGDRVAFVIYNGPEWHVVRMACSEIGAVSVPILTEFSLPDLQSILESCRPRLVVARDAAQFDKVRLALQGAGLDTPILGYSVDSDLGEPSDVDYADTSMSEDDLAMIFYTSGTTAEPKGVMHTHRSLLTNAMLCSGLFPIRAGDIAMSFLPVSHIYQQMVDTVTLRVGAGIAYVDAPDQLASAFQEVEPRGMVAVPRMFEVMTNVLPRRIETNLKEKSIVLQKLVPLAIRMGQKNLSERAVDRIQARTTNAIFGPIRRKVRNEVFGSNMRFFISGGAPLPAHAGSYLQGGLEVPLYQGWGMTEVAGAASVNTAEHNVIGSCGRAIPGIELRLGPLPEDLRNDLPENCGEILVRGPVLTTGYFEDPEATSQALQDGWLRTGDIGYIDEREAVWIVDRIKGFLVLDDGLKVMPQSLEDRLRSLCPLIDQIVVIGDKRPHLVALVFPSQTMVEQQLREPYRDAEGDWTAQVKNAILDQLNAVEVARQQRIRNIELLRDALSPQDRTLTPTQKPRRRGIQERYASVIDRLYA